MSKHRIKRRTINDVLILAILEKRSLRPIDVHTTITEFGHGMHKSSTYNRIYNLVALGFLCVGHRAQGNGVGRGNSGLLDHYTITDSGSKELHKYRRIIGTIGASEHAEISQVKTAV